MSLTAVEHGLEHCTTLSIFCQLVCIIVESGRYIMNFPVLTVLLFEMDFALSFTSMGSSDLPSALTGSKCKQHLLYLVFHR